MSGSLVIFLEGVEMGTSVCPSLPRTLKTMPKELRGNVGS